MFTKSEDGVGRAVHATRQAGVAVQLFASRLEANLKGSDSGSLEPRAWLTDR